MRVLKYLKNKIKSLNISEINFTQSHYQSQDQYAISEKAQNQITIVSEMFKCQILRYFSSFAKNQDSFNNYLIY